MEQGQPQTQQAGSNDEEDELIESIPIPYSGNDVMRGPVDAYEARCPGCGSSRITRFTTEDGRHVTMCYQCNEISCPHCGKILSKNPTHRREREQCPKCGMLLV